MEIAEMNHKGAFIDDLSADSSDACRVFGEPQLLPRMGDDHQVEIPALIPRGEYDSYLMSPTDAENLDHVPFDFLVGLPLPVMWINNINKEMVKVKDENQDFSIASLEAVNSKASSIFERRKKIDPYGVPGYSLVPGICGDSWKDIEKASFVLGLYIFEKKFDDLKKFVGCKKMGDILLFYYGEFYRSTEYSRWSCRKMKYRKCVYGERIFGGLRQQKLLSRLLPQVSEECRKALLEVSKTFRESDMSLEEYVSSIKAMVGMKSFVEAVAIGKGKCDLTGMAIEPVISNQASHMRQEIPVGKACASLMHTEIVKFLTGGYRLSKARSNDLFWEAVWPRLLARGWQSEQTPNQPYVLGAKHSLVFLTPGIKKFSKNLEKGIHYFDSVTDVLSMVGSEPELIELDTEKDEGDKKEENGWIEETKEEEKMPQRHSYLQPQTLRHNVGVMKFTIVDTSLENGKVFKLRELRNMPMDISKTTILSENSDQGTSEVSTNESDCAHNMLVDAPRMKQKVDSWSEQAAQEETNSTTHVKIPPDRGMIFDRKDFGSSSSDQVVQINGLDSTEAVKKLKRQNNLYDDKQTRKAVQSDLSQQPKQYDPDNLASVTKRHRTITACSNEEISSGRSTFPLIPKFGEDMYGSCSDSHDPTDRALSQVGSSQDWLSFTCSPKGSPPRGTGGAQDTDCRANPQRIPHFRTLIDLNLPAQPIEFEDGVFMTDSTNMQDDMRSKQHEDLVAPETSADVTVSDQQPANMNSRRQSTRNRPPTARALEALANGYLTTRRRKKNSDAHETSTLRPPRRSRVSATEYKTNDHIIVGGGGTGATDGGNVNMFDKFEGLSHGSGSQISNP